MKQLEYKIEFLDNHILHEFEIDFMNEQGEQGWELIQYDHRVGPQEKKRLIFKREKQQCKSC